MGLEYRPACQFLQASRKEFRSCVQIHLRFAHGLRRGVVAWQLRGARGLTAAALPRSGIQQPGSSPVEGRGRCNETHALEHDATGEVGGHATHVVGRRNRVDIDRDDVETGQ